MGDYTNMYPRDEAEEEAHKGGGGALTEDDKKALVEYFGECWYRGKYNNRTFDTPDDMMWLKDQLEKQVILNFRAFVDWSFYRWHRQHGYENIGLFV